MAALVFSTHLWLISVSGPPVPIWDQWDLEARNLYKPWLTGTLQWRDLIAPHNEHRMVLTRLVDLAILTTTGEWNLWIQLLVSATLDALCAAAIVATLWQGLPRRVAIALSVAVALVWIAPVDCMSPTHGHDSSFYFLRLLSTLAFAAFASAKPLSLRWCFGCCATLLVLGSMASGLLTAVAGTVSLIVIALLSGGRSNDWATLGTMVVIALMGGLLHVSIPGHALAKASSVTQFLIVFSHCLAWPHVGQGLAIIVMQLPFLWLLIDLKQRQAVPDPPARFALMLAALAVLSAAAVAYGRAGALPDHQPFARYYGPFLLGVVAQFFALCRVSAHHGRMGRLVLLGWSGFVLLGLFERSIEGLTEQLPMVGALHRESYRVARHFVVTGDLATFKEQARYPVLYPNSEVPAQVLSDSILRPILPASLRFGLDDERGKTPWLVRHGRDFTLIMAGIFILTVISVAQSKTADE